MKNRHISLQWILLLSLLALWGCTQKEQKESRPPLFDSLSQEGRLPRVLFLTTGMNYGNGALAGGVIEAIQTFSSHGAFVRLENREILFDPEQLSQFDILILLTASEYHDADRKHSLVYLADEEMKILDRWVLAGGTLVAGENIGRNRLDGTDRIESRHKLDSTNWPLAATFGLSLIEKEVTGYRIDGSGIDSVAASTQNFLPTLKERRWSLVPDSIDSTSTRILAQWISDRDTLAAWSSHLRGKGEGILLAGSNFLHPAGQGGGWSKKENQNFYRWVLEVHQKRSDCKIQRYPWPEGAPYALALSIDAEGDSTQYLNYKALLSEFNAPSLYWVHENVDPWVRQELLKSGADLGNNGFHQVHSSKLTSQRLRGNLVRNEFHWSVPFKGFRFPHSASHYAGLTELDRKGYLFDASLSSDLLDGDRGSLFPYNLPINNTGYSSPAPTYPFFQTLDLLELSPLQKEDYHFFSRLLHPNLYNEQQMKKDAELYTHYLANVLDYSVRAHSGMLHYFGHLTNTAHNETTLRPLRFLLGQAEREAAWIVSPDSLASYWKRSTGFQVFTRSDNHTTKLQLIESRESSSDSSTISLSFLLPKIPKSVRLRWGEARLKERIIPAPIAPDIGAPAISLNPDQPIPQADTLHFLLLDGGHNQQIEIEW